MARNDRAAVLSIRALPIPIDTNMESGNLPFSLPARVDGFFILDMGRLKDINKSFELETDSLLFYHYL
jgi:hypothetical protein